MRIDLIVIGIIIIGTAGVLFSHNFSNKNTEPIEKVSHFVPYTPTPADDSVECTTAKECGGLTMRIPKSVCDSVICCHVGGSWLLYEKEECLKKQKEYSENLDTMFGSIDQKVIDKINSNSIFINPTSTNPTQSPPSQQITPVVFGNTSSESNIVPSIIVPTAVDRTNRKKYTDCINGCSFYYEESLKTCRGLNGDIATACSERVIQAGSTRNYCNLQCSDKYLNNP